MHSKVLLLTAALFILSSLLFLSVIVTANTSLALPQRAVITSSPQNAMLNSPTPLKNILVSNKLSVKITSPVKGQRVSVNNNVTIHGTSSDNATSDCQVFFIVNDMKPYKKTIPTGKGSKIDDYSTWMYILGNNNSTSIKEGANKMTAKLTCFGSKNNGSDPLRSANSTKWYSVNFTGVVNGHPSLQPNITRGVISSSNNSIGNNNSHSSLALKNGTGRITLIHNVTISSYKPILPTTVNGLLKKLAVLLNIGNDPINRGQEQTIAITVSDLNVGAKISGAKVAGEVRTNQSGSLKQAFEDITNADGKVSYSWKIPLTGKSNSTYNVQVNVSANGYENKSTFTTFKVISLPGALDAINSKVNDLSQKILEQVRNGFKQKGLIPIPFD